MPLHVFYIVILYAPVETQALSVAVGKIVASESLCTSAGLKQAKPLDILKKAELENRI